MTFRYKHFYSSQFLVNFEIALREIKQSRYSCRQVVKFPIYICPEYKLIKVE